MILLLSAVLLLAVNSRCPGADGLGLMATDQQVLEVLNQTDVKENQQVFRGCIQMFFERGYYTPIQTVLNERDNTELSNSLNSAIAGRISKINAFIEVLDMPTTNLEPVVKWAQNHSHVFLSFKLSHRIDSPPCVNIKQEKKIARNIPKASESINQLQNEQLLQPPTQPQEGAQSQLPTPILSSFHYTCQCIVSHQRVFFTLNIDFWERLDDIEVKKDGVGTYTLIGRKLQPKIWRYLEMAQKRMQIWEELRYKYEKAMNQFFQLIDDEEEQLEATRKKPKKKKRPTTPTNNTNINVEVPKPTDDQL